jgi:hypothetical protein
LSRIPLITFDTKKLDVTYYPTEVFIPGLLPWFVPFQRDDLKQPLLDKFSVRGKDVQERMERAYIFPDFAVLEVVTT